MKSKKRTHSMKMNKNFHYLLALGLFLLSQNLFTGCKNEPKTPTETAPETKAEPATIKVTADQLQAYLKSQGQDASVEINDPIISQFYGEAENAVNYASLDSLLTFYDYILVKNNFVKIIHGDTISAAFKNMQQKGEHIFPVYGTVEQTPYDVNSFAKFVNAYLDKMEELPKNSPLYKILGNYKKLKEGKELGPKTTMDFFVKSFDSKLWADPTYRKVGYMLYFLLTTIDAQK